MKSLVVVFAVALTFAACGEGGNQDAAMKAQQDSLAQVKEQDSLAKVQSDSIAMQVQKDSLMKVEAEAAKKGGKKAKK